MLGYLDAFRRNTGGGTAIIFGISLPLVVGLGAAGMDYGSLVKRKGELQRAADGGSIAGVGQFKLANTTDAAAIQAAIAMAQAQAQAQGSPDRQTTIKADVQGTHSAVHVSVSEVVPLSMGKIINVPSVTVTAQSTAKLSGSTRLCLLALDPAAVGAFHLESAAQLTATDCSLYSNSSDASGIQAENNAVATSTATCTVGGYAGNSTNFTPTPATGCAPLKDPLLAWPGPPVGPCVSPPANSNPKKGDDGPDNGAAGAVVVSGTVTLDPGTYCGGLHITKKSNVTLRSGVYVMKDGPLTVDKKASMSGVGVGVYFTGNAAALTFDQDSTISLKAPVDGPMAGLLIAEDRVVSSPVAPPPPASGKGPPPPPPGGAQALREYRIISDNARVMLGTIYLPVGRLIVDSKKPVADQSAYTVIVARLIDLYDGPNLVLNAQYANTDVPVPDGVGPSSADTVLSQ